MADEDETMKTVEAKFARLIDGLKTKPCPFCGHAPSIRVDRDTEETPSRRFRIECGNEDCDADITVRAGELDEAIAKWEARVDVPIPTPQTLFHREVSGERCDFCLNREAEFVFWTLAEPRIEAGFLVGGLCVCQACLDSAKERPCT